MTSIPERAASGTPEPNQERGRGPAPAPTRLRIPGYEIDEIIGRGASGVVFRARQMAVDREVALKVLRPELSRNPRVIQRLKREARTTARLAHPNVISAIDMGETDGRWWYAMELVEGGTLEQLIKVNGQVDERQALRLFIPLVEALVHLAEHGVVHRDIKPANILIDDRKGVARLADLGLAFADDDPERTLPGSATLGTPAFMSPEQAVDSSAADAQSDLWSLGATLFHALTGRPPFAGGSAAEVLSEVLYARVEDPISLAPDLSRGLALVVRKCLTRDRAQRYRSAGALLADLERVRERRTPNVRRGELERSPREVRQQRLLLGALAAGFVVVGAWIGLPLLTTPKEEPIAPATMGDDAELLALEERVEAGEHDKAAQYLRELGVLAAGLGEHDRERVRRLQTRLRRNLHAQTDRIRRDIQSKLENRLKENDFERARVLLANAEEDVLRQSGCTAAELQSHGILIVRLTLEERDLQNRIASALNELERAAQATVDDHRARARTLFPRGDRQAARDTLNLTREELLQLVGFAEYRFSATELEDRLGPIEQGLKLQWRNLRDDWGRTNRALVSWLGGRASTLQRELRESPNGVFDASSDLRAEFERQLQERKITAASLPSELDFSAADKCEEWGDSLRSLEEELLEEQVSVEFAAIESLERTALKERNYERVRDLWVEAGEATRRSLGHPDAAWRSGYARTAELRAARARRLESVLDRLSDRILELNGNALALILGGIRRTGVVQAGVDPRGRGFVFIESGGRERTVRLESLPARVVERLLGWVRAPELVAAERLDHALFLFANGELERSQAALRSGPLPNGEELKALAADLKIDLQAAMARSEDRSLARAVDAQALLDRALLNRRWTHSPRAVLAEIDELLNSYGDLFVVRERRADLKELRDRLQHTDRPASLEDFKRVYPDARVTFPKSGRVELSFDFKRLERPVPINTGDWNYDGAGWALSRPVASWSELRAEHGPRLVVASPVTWTAEGFRLEFELEPIEAGGQGQCWVVSVAGMHFGFAQGQLPGSLETSPRWLVTGGSLDDHLSSLRLAETTRAGSRDLLTPGEPIRLTLTGSTATGRLKVKLGNLEFRAARNLRVRSDAARTVEFRSWEPARLLNLKLEAGR